MATIPAHTFDIDTGADSVSFAPLSGMVIDATGHVTYNFQGHVHATGLDLDAATLVAPATPPSDEKVRWLSLANGAVVGELGGYETPGAQSAVYMQADRNGHTARLETRAGLGGAQDAVFAYANGVGFPIWDGNFSSGFHTTAKGGSGAVGVLNLWAGIVVHTDIFLQAALLTVTASAYSNAVANGTWNLLWDGALVGGGSFLFNATFQHMQLGTTIAIPIGTAIGNHTLQLVNTSPATMIVDVNDNNSWALIG